MARNRWLSRVGINMEYARNASHFPIMHVDRASICELDFATGSADEAVAQFQTNPRRMAAEADFAPHRDAVIVGVAFVANQVTLALSDGSILSLTLRRGTISWNIVEASLPQPIIADDMPRLINLLWSNQSTPWLWHRARLLESRVGKRAFNVSAGHVNVFLYCVGCPILRFGPMVNAATGSEFLFWCETN